MKLQSKLISFFMILLFLILLAVNYALNISGPAMKADAELQAMINQIRQDYPQADDFYRHSFRYITYSAQTATNYYWFNQNGELIVSKRKSSAKLEEAAAVAETYGIENAEVKLGYGTDNPVYVIEQGGIMLYLDYDTLDVVYYMKERLL